MMRRLPHQLLFLLLCIAACAPFDEDELGMDTYSTSYPGELRGFVSTTYRPDNIAGWDGNRCVPDPIGQIANLRRRGDAVGFRWSGDVGWSSGCFMTDAGSTCL